MADEDIKKLATGEVIEVMAWDNRGNQIWPVEEPIPPKRDPLEAAANWGIVTLTVAALGVLAFKLIV